MTNFHIRYICTALAAIATVCLITLPAGAAGFGPKKLEDLAHFTTAGGNDCKKSAFGVGKTFASRVIDTGISPNGVSRFGLNIPPGMAFIMTSAQLSVVGGTPYEGVQIRLVNSQGGGGGVEYMQTFAESNLDGHTTVSAAFQPGILVRNFTHFCAEASGNNPTAIVGIVHGFLVDD